MNFVLCIGRIKIAATWGKHDSILNLPIIVHDTSLWIYVIKHTQISLYQKLLTLLCSVYEFAPTYKCFKTNFWCALFQMFELSYVRMIKFFCAPANYYNHSWIVLWCKLLLSSYRYTELTIRCITTAYYMYVSVYTEGKIEPGDGCINRLKEIRINAFSDGLFAPIWR